MARRPKPLTPADCDLRGLPYMPLHGERLIESDLFFISSGEEFKAALALWWASWKQVPAASLPNNPRVLAGLARVNDAAKWESVRENAMHGWVLCSDDRYYHPVIAELALIAWAERQGHQAEKEADTERKRRERDERKQLFAGLKARGVHLPWNVSLAILRQRAGEEGVEPVHDLSGGQVVDRPAPVPAKKRRGSRRELDSTPQPPEGGGEPEGFAKAWQTYPVEGRANHGPDRAEAEWPAAVERAGGVAQLQAAIEAHAAQLRRTAGKAKSFDRWLRDGGFVAYLGAGAGTDGPAPMLTWHGPRKVLDVVADGMRSEAKAISYLARCTWQDMPKRAVVAPDAWVRDKLLEAGLDRAGYEIQIQEGRAA